MSERETGPLDPRGEGGSTPAGGAPQGPSHGQPQPPAPSPAQQQPAQQPPAWHPAPPSWDRQDTSPGPTVPAWGPPATEHPGQPPYGPPSYGPYGSAGYPGPAYGQLGWSGEAAPQGGTATATRSPRWRLGVAGLVAGALIGGGTGAGVVALSDRHGGTTASASGPAAQSVVIKDPQKATSATAAAAKAAPSVVTIYVTTDSGAGSGSGVVLSADGYVLTNNHVVTLEGSGTGQVQVRTANGTLYDASVVGTDASDDLAVVKLDGAKGLTPATFADSEKVQVGDLAVAIGAPLGLSNTVTDGIISATGRAVETGSTQDDATVIDAIQTDAAINPGNSGGALVDAAGQVVGINTAIASVAQEGSGSQSSQSGNIGVGFAIPSNSAKRIADQIIRTGKATHAVLGVSARTASSSQNPDAGEGAEVAQVVSGGPAEKAGLQVGDVITGLDDRVVTSSVDLTAVVRSQAPGSDVTLTVKRGNATQKVKVTLSETNG